MPYATRYFKTIDDAGELAEFNHGGFGDVRLRATYTGLSEDHTTGISFGIKLPTGDYTYPGFDRDTSLGTGSTDLLLGAYHVGNVTEDFMWNWFANVQLIQPLITQDDYRPGAEINATVGGYYDGWTAGSVKFSPLLQVIASYRWQDSGAQANTTGSGYDRVLISPGFTISRDDVKLTGSVALPIYQHVNGNQLTAPALFKLNVSYNF